MTRDSISLDSLQSRLQHLEPVVLTGPDDSLRVLERTGRVVCEVPVGYRSGEDSVAAEIANALSGPAEGRREPPLRLRVNVLFEALTENGVCRDLAVLVESLKASASVQIVVHFAAPPAKWDSVLAALKLLRESLRLPNGEAIQVIGPFAAAGEPEMESLYGLGVAITFAAGWVSGGNYDQCGDLDTDALRAFSRFGFRTPIVWYVHEHNISRIEEQLPETLARNYYSGFALPLVSCSPFYRFGEGYPSLPNAVEYCRFLARCYTQYPYYDDVLSPLNDLAMLIRYGGWHSQFNVPATMQILVGADGRVGLYSQTPALAIPWTNLSEVVNSPSESLCDDFLHIAAEAWQLQKNVHCRDCQWRYICGGVDTPSESGRGTMTVMDAMCEYRRLFLEHFALLRTPDVVLTATKQIE